jgi:hypothetical protein
METGNLPNIGRSIEHNNENAVPMYATLFKIALIDSQWLLYRQDRKKDLRFDTRSKRGNDIISAIIHVISLLHNVNNENCDCDDIDTFIDEVDVKVATSILTGRIQPLEEVKTSRTKGSLRAQIIAEEELRNEEEGIDEGGQDEEGEFEEGEAQDEEEDEEREGVEYGDELPEFDEGAYYEGVVRTIAGHFESLGLNCDTAAETEIRSQIKVIEKYGNRLKINFYA